jgi:riboflavin biosynthesis pyrimidine reductase
MQQKLTPEIIIAAIAGFEAQKTNIDSQIAELRGMLDGGRTALAKAPPETATPRKKFSAAARRKMVLAQQARWAKIKGESEPASQLVTAEPAKRKRRMSAAGRKAISEATKRRWALKRAESEKLTSATTEAQPKRKISAAARRKMAEGAKKRWAAKKAVA